MAFILLHFERPCYKFDHSERGPTYRTRFLIPVPSIGFTEY